MYDVLLTMGAMYLGHEAPGGVDTFPDEGLQLGALADGGVVKQSRADLRHHVLQHIRKINRAHNFFIKT